MSNLCRERPAGSPLHLVEVSQLQEPLCFFNWSVQSRRVMSSFSSRSNDFSSVKQLTFFPDTAVSVQLLGTLENMAAKYGNGRFVQPSLAENHHPLTERRFTLNPIIDDPALACWRPNSGSWQQHRDSRPFHRRTGKLLFDCLGHCALCP